MGVYKGQVVCFTIIDQQLQQVKMILTDVPGVLRRTGSKLERSTSSVILYTMWLQMRRLREAEAAAEQAKEDHQDDGLLYHICHYHLSQELEHCQRKEKLLLTTSSHPPLSELPLMTNTFRVNVKGGHLTFIAICTFPGIVVYGHKFFTRSTE